MVVAQRIVVGVELELSPLEPKEYSMVYMALAVV